MPAAASLPRSAFALVLAIVATIGVSLGSAGPVTAALPRIALMVTATPNPATGTVTYTGTIYPVSGTTSDVRVHMDLSSGTLPAGTCQPAPNCAYVGFRPEWTFSSISSRTVITYETTAQDQRDLQLWLDSDQLCVGGCPASVYLPQATLRSTFSWSTTTQVDMGSTLHVTVHNSTDGWWPPFPVANEIILPASVAAPTNLPADAAYYAGVHRISRPVTIDPTDEWSFDVVVTSGAGQVMMFGSYLDGLNTYSDNLTIKVGEDHTAPRATGPTRSLSGGPLSGGKAPVRLAWTGSDYETGVATYSLSQSTDGHAWTTVATGLTSTATTRFLSSGHSYRFRVRAVDHVGNVGPWANGSTFTLSSASERSSTLHYGGKWALKSSSSYRGGKAKVAATAGRTVSRTFTGTSFGWLASKGPTQGKAQVSVNGTVVATIDLYALTTQPQQLVWTRNYSSSKSRTIKIKVIGTLGRPGVSLDGVFVIR